MSSEADGSLAAFKRLLDHASSDAEELAPVTFTEALVGGTRANVLRRCAIPHEFNCEMLRVLEPSLTAEEASRCYDRFLELSIIQVRGEVLSMHERWRKPLFKWWLRPENYAEFAEVSRRLAANFLATDRREDAGSEVEPTLRKHLYHLIGADPPAGFTMFKSLCRRARRQWRFTECAALIKLVSDYLPILPEELKASLAYQEGKLASDLRDWGRAEELFRGLDSNAFAPIELRIAALTRLGHALREQGRVSEAIQILTRAESAATGLPSANRMSWRVLLELGESYRDVSQLEDAERTLLASIEAARSSIDQPDCAVIYNSLGTVYLKRRESLLAINAFRASLEHLEREGDLLQTGQVQNNLALAYSEQLDWQAAERAFAKSLELKRQAGDLLGQGLALQNLSRVQTAQDKVDEGIASVKEAIAIFTELKDARRAGVAKHTLGKLLRNLGDTDGAGALFKEASALLEASGDADRAAAARADLNELKHKVGLPWWAWVAVALIPVVIVALVIAVWLAA